MRGDNVRVEADIWLYEGSVPVVSGVDSVNQSEISKIFSWPIRSVYSPVVQHVYKAAVVVHCLPHHGLAQSLAIKLN